MRRLERISHARERALVLAFAVAAMVLVPASAHAQMTFTQVPPSSSTATQSTVVVVVNGNYGQSAACYAVHDCYYYPWDSGYQQYTETATLNGGSVTSAFTVDEQSNCWTSDGYWDNYECDQTGTMTGTLTYPVGHHTLAVAVLADDGSSWSNSYAFWVTAPPPPPAGPLAVAVNALVNPSLPANAGTQSTWFMVRNTGGSPGTVFLSAACTAALSTGPCTPSLQEAYLGLNDTLKVRIDFPVMVAGTSGTATLVATDPQTGAWMNSGTSGVTVVSPPRAIIASPTLQAGANFERTLCPDIAVAPNIATQCGALRATHALPSVTTFGKTYTPTLAYYSDNVMGVVALVDITIPAGQPIPSQVTVNSYDLDANLNRVSGIARYVGHFTGADWSTASRSRRINTSDMGYAEVDQTIRDVEFEVVFDGVPVGSVKGQVVPLHRFAHAVAKGWWLLGLEELVPNQDGGSILWIDGDGSTRQYKPIAPGVYAATSLTRADSLFYDNGTGGWYRKLPNSARVNFDAYGRHSSTRDRYGRTTTFTYTNPYAKSPIATITVPGGLTYTFSYSGGWVTINAPGAAGARTVTLAPTGTGQGVQSITDPDGSSETFQYYGSPADYILAGYVDKRGTTTALGWAGCGRTLTDATTSLDASHSVVSLYKSPYGIASCGGTAERQQSDYDVDGPRTDVADIGRLWVDSLGAVTQSTNALGQSTSVEYGDVRFPGLVTRVVHANGFAQTTAYDARGHVASTTSWNPLGDGRNGTTRYSWDPSWDQLTRIETPEHVVTEIGYDAATGDRRWQQTGGITHRATFDYYSGALASRIRSSQTPTGETEQYSYDALGNLSQIVTPLGITLTTLSDGIGRDTLSIGALGVRTRTRYNAAGLISDQWTAGNNAVMAESVYVHTDYDLGGNKLQVIRQSLPDTAHIGTLTDSWQYDRLGRDTVHFGVGGTLRVRYNPAGQVVWTNHGDSTQYDVLGRRTWHSMPAVVATDLAGTRLDDAATQGAPADEETYAYDPQTGGLSQADNRYAKVRRSYYPNGALRRDSSLTRIEHAYDLDGRPVRLRHDALTASQTSFLPDSVTYGYDAATGALTSIMDPEQHVFGFTYDDAGRLKTRTGPPGVLNSFDYDADSRVRSHDGRAIVRDDAGRVISATNGSGSTFTMQYSPVGGVTSLSISGNQGNETFVRDALGNMVSRWSDIGGMSDSRYGRWTFGYSRGFVHSSSKLQTTAPYSGQYVPDQVQAETDLFGNRTLLVTDVFMQTPALTADYNPCFPGPYVFEARVQQTRQVSVYDANNKLRFVTTHSEHDGRFACEANTAVPGKDSLFVAGMAYRYDALGRRVWVQSKAPTYYNGSQFVTHCCDRILTQAWDGSELLVETQVVPNVGWGANGSVVYTNGGTIDRPLSIARRYGPCGGLTYYTKLSWRGLLDFGGATPSTYSCGQASGGGGTYWPEQDYGASPNGRAYDPSLGWNGSLLSPGQDEAGLSYMRNRYYDSKTGQFSQEDPAGIAGGLNTYGFAKGDPVNYSDPFGLCPTGDKACEELARKLQESLDRLNRRVREWNKAVTTGNDDESSKGHMQQLNDDKRNVKTLRDKLNKCDDDDHYNGLKQSAQNALDSELKAGPGRYPKKEDIPRFRPMSWSIPVVDPPTATDYANAAGAGMLVLMIILFPITGF